MKEERQEPAIYSLKNNILRLAITIKPQAKRNEILGIMNNRLKIAISATTVDGKANKKVTSHY